MTFEEFKNSVIGRGIDFDGGYGNQCVDLIRQYCADVFGKVRGVHGNAIDYWTNFENLSIRDDFYKVINTPDLVVEKGDIVVWNTNVGGGYGHVAIGLGLGDTKGFQSLDQNWGSPYVKQVGHNFNNVIGVLRVRDKNKLNGSPTPPPAPPKPPYNPNVEIKFRGHVQNIGWQNWVTGGNIIGTTGQGLRVEAVQFDFPFACDVKAHIQNIGWREYKNISRETVIGTTGQGLRLEALIIYPHGNKYNLIGKVHIENKGWTNRYNLPGDISLGTAGEGLRLEAIQLWYENI